MTQGRTEIHNAAVVTDVAEAGGCGFTNLRNGATCGLEFGHKQPCDLMAPEAVPQSLAARGIKL